ncbi:hypothetical protein COO72_10895 [Bifidobacterium callitrichos]|nr:hypothetical protein COO72_10895 [Bifidobacterium callitrichos]
MSGSLLVALRDRLTPSDLRYRFRLARDGALDVKHPKAPLTIVMIRRTPIGYTLIITGPGLTADQRIRTYSMQRFDDLAQDVARILGAHPPKPTSSPTVKPTGTHPVPEST